MENYENLIVEEKDQVVRVVINREKVLNALNLDVLKELQKAIAASNSARVFVIEGAGEKAFVAGADISQMSKLSTEEALAFSRLGQKVFKSLEEANFISIAKVDGYALGGGCELAMACDMILASNKSVFGQPEVDLGLIAGFGGTQRLVKRIGLPKAMHILVGGKKLTAEEAFTAGLICEVCDSEQLEERTLKLSASILRAGPRAVIETKKLLQKALETPLENGLSQEAATFANCFAGEQAREGMLAFLEKRKASFS